MTQSSCKVAQESMYMKQWRRDGVAWTFLVTAHVSTHAIRVSLTKVVNNSQLIGIIYSLIINSDSILLALITGYVRTPKDKDNICLSSGNV